jgi:hypothetical protein
MQQDGELTARVVITVHMSINYGTQVTEWHPGDVATLPLTEATIWCLREWAMPLPAQMVEEA